MYENNTAALYIVRSTEILLGDFLMDKEKETSLTSFYGVSF